MTLRVGETADLRIVLAVGGLQQSVEVTAAAQMVETTKSDVSAVVTTRELSELPVLNRGFIGLAALLPGGGPARAADARFGVQTAFGGTNVRSMYSLYIDGGVMDNPVLGFALVNVNQDAVQEFRVLHNQFDAEYSGAGTAVVNVLTRSGTNALRGMFSYYGRDDALNAMNAFAKTKPPFDSTRASVTLGGPIKKDKAHFFGAVEYLRTNSVTIIALPAANPFSGQYNGVYPNGSREKTGHAKVNYSFNQNHNAWVRYLRDDANTFETSIQGQNWHNKFHNVAGEWNWTLSPTKLNTVSVVYLKQRHGRTMNTADPQVGRPSFTSGRSPNLPQLFPRTRVSVNETLFWTAGHHALKTGIRSNYEMIDFIGEYYGQGVWTFNTDRPFNAADPTTWPVKYTTGPGESTQRYHSNEFGFFVQDDWRLFNRLTLNLGLRYDIDTNLRSNDYIAKLLANPQFKGLEKLVTAPRGNDWDQLQPRAGFAWDTRGNGRTVIRGGFGLYAVRNRPWFNILGMSVTNQFTAEVTDPQLLKFYPDRTAVLGGRSIADYVQFAGGRHVYLPGDNLQLPRVMNITLGVGKALFKDTSLEIDLIHSKQTDLQSGRDANLPPKGPLATNPRPLTQFSSVTLYGPVRTSWYDALQTSFKTRYRSASFQVAYTWSKAISDGTDDNAETSVDPWHVFGNDDRGLDENDRRHALTWSSIVQFPWNVQISAIVSLRSGNPWDITAGVDLDGDGNRQDRPPGLAKNTGGSENAGTLAIINAFRAGRNLAPITMAQLGQTSAEKIVDIRATKRIPFAGRQRLDLFFEAYNLLNTVNYANPSGTLTSGSFAVRTAAGQERQIQWGARFSF